MNKDTVVVKISPFQDITLYPKIPNYIKDKEVNILDVVV